MIEPAKIKMLEKWEQSLKKWKQGDPLPPCPSCGSNAMRAWDLWLVTGETCDKCGWSASEGSGALL